MKVPSLKVISVPSKIFFGTVEKKMLENTGSKYWFFLQDVWNKGKVFVKSRKKNSLLFSFYLILHGKCYQYFFASVLGSRLLAIEIDCEDHDKILSYNTQYIKYRKQ